MEQQIQIGTFIRDMRTERGMTQQQLADRLGITDKAVSKWERNICCPDITLLRPLADALGVTVTELLSGSREAEEAPEPAVEDIVVSAISYSETARRKNGAADWRLWVFAGLTGGCLVAALVCMICDLVMSGTYTWSLPVYPSLGLGWLVCTPLLLARRHPAHWSLAALTAAVLPYLCVMGWLLRAPLMIRISLWVAPMALVYLWLVYALCLRLGGRNWLIAGWSLLLAAPLGAGINFVLDRYLTASGYHEVWIALLLAAACFTVDYVLRRRGR